MNLSDLQLSNLAGDEIRNGFRNHAVGGQIRLAHHAHIQSGRLHLQLDQCKLLLFLPVFVLIMTRWVYRIACGARIADRSTIPRASEWIRTETLTPISAESAVIRILAPKRTRVRPLSPRPNHKPCVTFCWPTVDESKLPCPSIPTPNFGSHLTDSPQSDRPIMRKW